MLQQKSVIRHSYLSLAQQFLNSVEEGAPLESSIAHGQGKRAVKARVIQHHKRIECCDARLLRGPRIAEQRGELIAYVISFYAW